MKNQLKDKVVVLILAITVLSIAVFFWIGKKLTPEPMVILKPVPVVTVRPRMTDLRNGFALSSVLESENIVNVTPRVGGKVLEVLVREGAQVNKDDLLVRIDDEPYLLKLQAAESAWRLAENKLARINRLKEKSGVSQQQLEESQTLRDDMRSAYKLAKMRYEYSWVRAPISGQILMKDIDVGSIASPEGLPMFRIGNTDDLRTTVRVPEKYRSSFKEPQNIKVFISYPAGGFTNEKRGSILRVGSTISPNGKTFKVVCSVSVLDSLLDAQRESEWPIGASLKVEFVLSERKDSWSLPLRAISGTANIWMVDTSNMKVKRLKIHKVYQDNENFVIPDDLADRLFVINSNNRLNEGQVVSIFEGDV